MARGVRKTALEKLQIELAETQAAIAQHETNLEMLKEQELKIMQQIELEEFKLFKSFLTESDMTIDDVKALIESQVVKQQSA